MPTFSIYQLATPGIDAYAKYSMASVRAYCQRHGYDSFVQRAKMVEGMHINWTKISMMIEGLETSNSDYCVLLDADTVIVNQDIQLDQVIPKPDQVISFARDNYYKRLHKPNAGLVIIRNNVEGLKIMKEWLHIAQHEGSEWADKHPRNQNVYWKFVEPKWKSKQRLLSFFYCRKHRKLYESTLFRQFIFHITYTESLKRKEVMKRLAEDYVPDIDKHMAEVEALLMSKGDRLQLV